MSAAPPAPPNPEKPRVKALNCPNCGATLELRSFEQAVNLVCGGCHSILDAKDPNLQILQKGDAAMKAVRPLIPLGTRGKIRGAPYEVIGFELRSILVEGISYSWHEYLLFNPYKGFRYLTQYDGHWNDTSTLRMLPTENFFSSQTVTYLGETYKHFQSADAATKFVLGEFPWQVRVGESVHVTDYVSPPRVLSSEKTRNETTWSLGEYMSGGDVWKAFELKGDPPEPVGVYENQPSPLGAATKAIWSAWAVFTMLLLAALILFSFLASNEQVFKNTYSFRPNTPGEASFVSDTFELKGRTSNVELGTTANVDNSWIYLNYALINEDTGQAFDFGREVSYYHGYDSDGSWSEGSTSDSVIVPSVPPGRYYLRVEPESDARSGAIYYTVLVRRDVPVISFFGLAFLALLAPAALITWRSMSFEHLRWAESDHAPSKD